MKPERGHKSVTNRLSGVEGFYHYDETHLKHRTRRNLLLTGRMNSTSGHKLKPNRTTPPGHIE